MLNDQRRAIDGRRLRRKRSLAPGADALRALEPRTLLAYTPLGISLPDLTVSGFAGPVAAYGGPIAVTVDVRNLGASSLVEPLNLQPNAPSTADAGPFTVGVYLSKSPRFSRGSILIGQIPFTGLPQNSLRQVTQTFTLPERPAGFPNLGQFAYLQFVVNNDQSLRELDFTNNVSTSVPVLIDPPLPQVQVIALQIPSTLQPGDTIRPSIKVANYGAVATDLQAPLVIQLVASTDRNFGPGDDVIATFTLDNLEPLAVAPTSNLVIGDANLNDPPNVRTVVGPQATLPDAPATYFVGLVVDPDEQIRMISDLRGPRNPALAFVQAVGTNPAGLPPAEVLSPPAPTTNLFPIPPFGPLATDGPLTIPDEQLFLEFQPRGRPRPNVPPSIRPNRAGTDGATRAATPRPAAAKLLAARRPPTPRIGLPARVARITPA